MCIQILVTHFGELKISIHPCNQKIWRISFTSKYLLLTFCSQTHSLPQCWQPMICFLSPQVISAHSRIFYKWKYTVCTFVTACFTQHNVVEINLYRNKLLASLVSVSWWLPLALETSLVLTHWPLFQIKQWCIKFFPHMESVWLHFLPCLIFSRLRRFSAFKSSPG